MSRNPFKPLWIVGSLLVIACLCQAAVADSIYLVSTNFPPYYGPDLPNGGVFRQITAEALKRGGHSLKVDWLPWARAVKQAEEGRADGIMGIWHSTEREVYFAYSLPLLSNQLGFYKRADSTISFRELSDLKPYRIGVVRASARPKGLDEAGLKIEEATDATSNLRKLDARRIDLALVEKGTAKYLIDAKLLTFKDWLVWLDPPVEEMPLFVVFSRKSPGYEEKLAAFNNGLKQMEADGTLAKLISQAGL